MRAILFSGLLILAATQVASADEHDGETNRSRLRFGVLAGVNFSDTTGRACTFSCDDVLPGVNLEATFKTKDQLSIGGFVLYPLHRAYALRLEARLTMKGAKSTHSAPAVMFDDSTPTDVFVQYTLEHTLRYAHLPVLIQRDIVYDGVFKPHLLAGIGLGYQWSTTGPGTGTAFNEAGRPQATMTGESELSDVSKRFDISVIAGVGTTFPLWRGELEVGVRYEMSILSAIDGTFDTMFETSEPLYLVGATEPLPDVQLDSAPIIAERMRHRVLSVLVGYRL